MELPAATPMGERYLRQDPALVGLGHSGGLFFVSRLDEFGKSASIYRTNGGEQDRRDVVKAKLRPGVGRKAL